MNNNHGNTLATVKPQSPFGHFPGASFRCEDEISLNTQFNGSTIDDLVGRPITSQAPGVFRHEIIVEEDRPRVAATVRSAIVEQTPYVLTYRVQHPVKGTRWLLEQGNAFPAAEARLAGVEGMISDISDIKQAQGVLAERAALMESARDAIFMVDEHCIVRYWNRSSERLLGWSAEDVSTMAPKKLLERGAEQVAEIIAAIKSDGAWSGNIRYLHKNGTTVEMAARMSTFSQRADAPAHPTILAINTDISASRALSRKLQRVALFDSLTGLPNRAHLLRELRGLRRRATAHPGVTALIVVDLHHFKAVNDLYGRRTGDRLLRAIGRELQSVAAGPQFVARVGGDEFALLYHASDDDINKVAQAAEVLARKIQLTIRDTCAGHIGNRQLHANIGITLFEHATIDIAAVLAEADSAVSNARLQPDLRISFYDAVSQQAAIRRIEREEELRNAINLKQFVLHFQPQMNSAGELVGAEVLLRWRHPQRGTVFPHEFIPIAEEAGLIHELGRWVLEEACRKLVEWKVCLAALQLPLAVNVSAAQFAHPSFTDTVLSALERSGADPTLLKLELTESLLVEDLKATASKMNLLRSHGIAFSLDDFGTGFAALAYLRDLPLAQVKIDMSFVKHIATNAHDVAIVRSIVALGQSLGISVIAEGVETEDQQRRLFECGCFEYQGFLYQSALGEKEFLGFMDEHAGEVQCLP